MKKQVSFQIHLMKKITVNKKNQLNSRRVLSPYEKNHLRKYDIDESLALESEIPVEHLSGKVEFCGLELEVGGDVLIPRVETEELVNLSVDQIKQIYQKTSKKVIIADVGTGSGAIAVCLAKNLEKLKIPFEIWAIDVSQKALQVAQKNIGNNLRRSSVNNIKLIKSDLLDSVPKNVLFDFVVANLPYIPTERIIHLDESVKDFEPIIALDGGPDGLFLIKKMLKQAEKLVFPHSKIILEIDYTHSKKDFEQFSKKWKINLKLDRTQGVKFATLSYHL
jgi:release factor glutamine methyltransferase